MPSIDDFDPTIYEPKPRQPRQPEAAPPSQPPGGGAGGFDIRALLAALPQAQMQTAGAGLEGLVGAVKELGQQATRVDRFSAGGGGIAPLQRLIGSVGRGDAPVPPATMQEGFAPQSTAEGVGTVGAKVGVPLLASLATGGAAGPLLTGASAPARIAASAGLEGVASGVTAGAAGEDPEQAALLGALFGGAGAGIGAGRSLVSELGKRHQAAKAAKAGSPIQQANDALGVMLKHVKDGQHPARAVIEKGINLKLPPEAVEAQITNHIEQSQAVKKIISDTLPPVPQVEIAAVLDKYGSPIQKLLAKVVKKVDAGELPKDTLDNVTGLQELLTTPGDVPPIMADKARGDLRFLIDQFATGNKKKGVRRGLEEARRALGDLTPALKAPNRDMADLIAARNAVRDKMLKEGTAGVPTPPPNKIAELLSNLPFFGRTSAALRGVGRLMK